MTTKQIMKHPGRLYKFKVSGSEGSWVVVRDAENTLVFDWDEDRILFFEPADGWEVVDADWEPAEIREYHDLIHKIFWDIREYRIER
jgi:hypothetical protein